MSKCYSDITRAEVFRDKNFHEMINVSVSPDGGINVSLTMNATLLLPPDAIEEASRELDIPEAVTELFAERMNKEMKDVFAVLRYKLQDHINKEGQINERTDPTNDIQQ